MNRLVKKFMVVLLSAFMFLGAVTTPVQAKGPSSNANGWGSWWGWWWWPTQPTEPEPEPEEEPVVEEEPVAEEEPEVTEEPVAEEEPEVTEEPVAEEEESEETEAPVVEEEIYEEQETPAEEQPVASEPQPIEADSKTEGYNAVISFDETAGIEADATATIEKYSETDTKYAEAKEAVLAATGVSEEAGFIAFDMTLYDAEGNEIEPAVDSIVNVALSVQLPEEALNADYIEIHHIDSVTKEVEQVATTENDDIVIDGNIANVDLTVGSFSTYTILYYGNRNFQRIHYVDKNGNELTPTMTPNFDDRYQYLIYDINGYEYDSTHRGSRTGDEIYPILRAKSSTLYNSGYVQYINGNQWSDLPDDGDIYVVYKAKKTPTTGGTPEVDQDEDWPEGDGAPQFGKVSKNNPDGTNTISLSIAAAEKPVEKSTPADVIVVFDVSGSMSEYMGNQTRLYRAQTAVNTMANALLNGENSDVRMALISFSTDAEIELDSGFTNNYRDFSSAVNGLTANGGTNWEKSLKLANEMQIRDNAATFVVFVTDGDPTFRVSRGNVSDSDLDLYSDGTYQYYRNNHVFGEGNDDSKGRNFDFAVEQVKAIVGANKRFYSIGISNDVTKVRNLTTQGGVDASHAFIASDATAMENAFKSITESIKSVLGFGDVEITDGITELTNAEMKVMQTVDPNSFKYYRWGGENNKYGATYQDKQTWTTREEDGCAAASYSKTDGAVHWDMGEGFQLEDGVNYVVEFTVWPSQDAYDLVADLNNGIKYYSYKEYRDAGGTLTEEEAVAQELVITEEERKQVVEKSAPTDTEQGEYALKTNTDNVKATYKKTTESGGVVSISEDRDYEAEKSENLQNLSLSSQELSITKIFGEAWDGKQDDVKEVNLVVTKETETGTIDYLTDVKLNESNQWSKEFFISCGLITNGIVREHGHDYSLKELPDAGYYYWDLTADVYRPMVIDGKVVLLVETDQASMEYEIDGKYYKRSTESASALTATNTRRSHLDLNKVIDGEAPADTLYTFKATFIFPENVQDPNVWFSAWDSAAKDYIYDNWVTGTGVTAEVKEGKQTGFFYAPTGTELTMNIKVGWNVRFLNLPKGTEYTITEDLSGTDFELKDIEVNKADTMTVVKADAMINGKVKDSNTGYQATFTNTNKFFYIYHSGAINEDGTDDVTGNLEKIPMTAVNEDGTYNLYNKTTPNTLYGGYYLNYGGKGNYKDDGVKSDGGIRYTGMNYNEGEGSWATCEPQTTDGRRMIPVAGETYYIKEVPTYYLRNYYQITYVKGSYDLKSLYLISAVDDLNYNETGFILTKENTAGDKVAKVVKTMTYKNWATGKTATLKANNVFKKVKGEDAIVTDTEFLTYYDATNSEEGYFAANTTFDVLPYWITPDEIKVTGNSTRRISIKDLKKTGISKEDLE